MKTWKEICDLVIEEDQNHTFASTYARIHSDKIGHMRYYPALLMYEYSRKNPKSRRYLKEYLQELLEKICQVHVEIQKFDRGFCPFKWSDLNIYVDSEYDSTIFEWLAKPQIWWFVSMNHEYTSKAVENVDRDDYLRLSCVPEAYTILFYCSLWDIFFEEEGNEPPNVELEIDRDY